MKTYAVFHLNLAFSAIPAEARGTVIDRCYTPLLDLIDAGFPLGLELTGWTLREIQECRPMWIQRFHDLLVDQRTELIGSGYVQLIGPLVPAAVNRHNLNLGMETYQNLLGMRPRVALVNEMAYAPTLNAHYREAGFEGLILERNNLETALGRNAPVIADLGETNDDLMPALLVDSLMFQKFQRLVHGDIDRQEFDTYLAQHASPCAIYCSDGEIFDYRPKRYAYETDHGSSQEHRFIHDLLKSLQLDWQTPSQALFDVPEREALTFQQPILVKKQPKYNLSRWAVTGRDDLWLNTCCHRLHKHLIETQSQDPAIWRDLCELWASDLRTHIHIDRFTKAEKKLARILDQCGLSSQFHHDDQPEGDTQLPDDPRITIKSEELTLQIDTLHTRLKLNLRRGLAISSLSFHAHEFRPLIGTLPHGYFREIHLGADFYTGHLILEHPQNISRITDLSRVTPIFEIRDDQLIIGASISTASGPVLKRIFVNLNGPGIANAHDFPGWSRPFGIMRVGNITLIPDHWRNPLHLRCGQGGERQAIFALDRTTNQAAAVSSLVSCTSGLGAVDGMIDLYDDQQGIRIKWRPDQCAAFPMLIHEDATPAPFTRLQFSLAEWDETRKESGRLPSWRCYITPLT